jgi:hypothetical protein
LRWLTVSAMTSALRLIVEHGGAVLTPPTVDDSVRLLATVRDPAGIVQHGTN